MKIKILFILLLIVVLLLSSLVVTREEYFNNYNEVCSGELPTQIIDNSYQEACKELVTKRNFLRDYVQQIRSPVQELNTTMILSKEEKRNNMAFQRFFTEKCSNLTPSIDILDSSDRSINNSTTAIACRALASVDKYQLELLPNVSEFYATVLLENKENLNEAFKLINFYTNMMKCSIPNCSRVTRDVSENIIDASGNSVNQNTRINIQRDFGVINSRELSLELEKLSPYYLSPDVVRYIIRFMISQEKLDYLNDTSADFVLGTVNLMNKIKTYY